MSEREAIERLRQGDIRGLEALVRAHELRALRAAYLIIRDRDLAEDVVADAFVRAYEQIGRFDGTRPFAPWFLRLVVNIARRRAAQRERHVPWSQADARGEMALDEMLVAAAPGPEDLAGQAALREAVWEALGRLSPAERAAVVQRYYLGLTEDEMAEASGCRPGTIKWRLHVARERLRDWLRPLWDAEVHRTYTPDKEEIGR
ncbi:MAG: RNA polymerase sigma factor [Anaerolineae bacterium]|nr:RNA polymerase sigma factor [Anaerolineae bacterium]